MALSATLAKPQELEGWRQSIQHQVSKYRNLSEVRKIHLIIHSERYNDLYMHFFSLRDQSASLLNPLRLSDTWDIRDIRLVPEQCVEILHTLQRGCHNTDILNELDYDLYLKSLLLSQMSLQGNRLIAYPYIIQFLRIILEHIKNSVSVIR